MPKIKPNVPQNIWFTQRELGQSMPLGHSDYFYKGLYSSFTTGYTWYHKDFLKNSTHGGIYNLEFSVDGSILAAACEKNAVLLFDPLNRKMTHCIANAHDGCVNCIKFLDSRVFASCGDDSTVAIWDSRNLKSKIRILHGHASPVSNIDYSPVDGLLLTSGFDGCIFTWDAHRLTDIRCAYKRVFRADGLVRTKLTRDGSKMIICTTGGYLMIVHNLNFRTLAQDLYRFNPSSYHLMQLNQTTVKLATHFSHLFSPRRKYNRVEFVCDFPRGGDIVVVSSLEIHPQGWCALSRNISNNDISEWTCVHDIQEHTVFPADDSHSDSENESSADSLRLSSDSGVHDNDSDSADNFPEALFRMGQAEGSGGGRGREVIGEAGSSTSSGLPQEFPGVNVGEQTALQASGQMLERAEQEGVVRFIVDDQIPSSASAAGSSLSSRFPSPPFAQPPAIIHLIHQDVPRLTHYVRELNVGQGFFKELCFSADGRLICSPYGSGVRFLSFSPECSELSNCFPVQRPVPLHELTSNICHKSVVVCTRFSPHHCFLVSGCLGGNIVWHQPF